MLNFLKENRGFSLIEIIIVIGIMVIIFSITVPSISRFRNESVLQNTSEEIISVLNKARNNTISSLNSNNYGVHFQNDRIVLFVGSTYQSGNSTNEEILFNQVIEIPSDYGVSLNGGGSNVIFDKITGGTDNYGIIILRLKTNENQRAININKLGVPSIN